MAGRVLPKIPSRNFNTMKEYLAGLRDATSLDAHSIQLTLAEFTQLLDPDNNAYDPDDLPQMPDGWEVVRVDNDTSTGFQGYAIVHRASNSLIVVCTPTQFKYSNDLITDLQGAIPHILAPGQLDNAIEFADQVFDGVPAGTYSNIYFPGFSLSNALGLAQMQYAHAMGWLDGANVSHVAMGPAYFGADILSALQRHGVSTMDSIWGESITHHYVDNNDVVPSTREINGTEGEIHFLPPMYLQDSLGGYHLVTDVAAHAGQAYIYRVKQMEALGVDLTGYALVVYAKPGGTSDFKLIPKSEIELVLPPAADADAIEVLPEGYVLDWSEIREENGTQLSVRGVTINGDYVDVVSQDLDGDGVYDITTKTYSNVLIRKPRETYTYRKYALSGPLGDDDYVYVGEVAVDANLNGIVERTQTVWTRGGLKVSQEKIYDEETGETIDVEDTVEFLGIDVSKIGSAFGSALGNAIFDDQLEQTLGSPVLQALGGNLAEAVGFLAIGQSGVEAFRNAFEDFTADLGANLAGAVSSYLVAEIVHAAGLDGTVIGDLGQSWASQTLTQIITNIATQVPPMQGVSGLNLAALGTLFATYLGTKLASKLVEFDTFEGQIGASLGAAIGTAVGTSVALSWAASAMKAGSIWGPIGAAIGAFVGYILGGLIGSMFAKKPRSGADVVWDYRDQRFEVGNVWTKGRAPGDATRSLADAVAGNLNAALDYLGARLLNPYAVTTGNYGIDGKDFVYRNGGHITYRTRDADHLVSFGTYYGLSSAVMQLAGGDVFAKRAFAGNLRLYAASPTSFSMETLLGDLSIATDYGTYVSDPSGVNALIAANPDSAFAAGWVATFARVLELGINKRAVTDWIGGFAALFDELPDGMLDGRALSAGNVWLDLNGRKERRFVVYDGRGVELGALGDTVETAAKDLIAGGSGADTVSVDGDRLSSTAGLSVNGQAGSANPYVIDVAAVIDGGAGNDFISGGDLGNDLLGGSGNDTLVGGKLDDWLLGDEGNDVLFAGKAANTGFVVTDLAAQAAAVGVDGGNGNYLYGGTGADRLYGSIGSDWLRGGADNDWLVGGRGGDILEGGSGDDRGANGEAAIFGGSGSDIYLFGRGDGKDVLFDESDLGSAPGSVYDSLSWRIQEIAAGHLARDWAGDGNYQADGSVKGGEDSIDFGTGLSMANVLLRRSGTAQAPGNDLIVTLVAPNSQGQWLPTGDEITIKDWFESTRRIEWLRFADGEEIRIGDMTSFAIGTGGSDVIIGTYSADFLYGGGGDDQLRGLAGDDFGNGGAGNDLVAGDGDNDWVMGGSGNDQVVGGAGHDTAFGDEGDDRVYGGLGSDLVVGGLGNDEVVGGAGDDVFRYSRGDGQDVVMDDYVNNWDLVWQDGVYVNGYALQSDGTVTKNGVMYFDGSKWLGQYDWDDEHQMLKRHAGAVNGRLASNAGVDTLEFGVGIDIQDLMLKKVGSDLLIAIGEENGTNGFDQVSDRITIKDWLNAPIENFVFAATGRHAVSAMSLSGGTDAGESFVGADLTTMGDWITGNGGDDTIDGRGGDDILAGNAGNDAIKGGAGVDVLFGGSGNDVLDGGAGADMLFGGDGGDDTASYASSATGVRVYLDAAAQSANLGDAEDDAFDGVEGLRASAADDILGGDGGDNQLEGGGGADTLYGGAGSDTYVIDRGSGYDAVYEGDYAVDANGDASIAGGDGDGVDAIVFAEDISLADLTFNRSENDLSVGVMDAATTLVQSSVHIVNQFVDGLGIEQLQLADGLSVDLDSLKTAGQAATASDDFMAGGSAADTLAGQAGDDVVSGARGNDTLQGGDGNDTLEGGMGADVLDGGSDSVTLAQPIEAGKLYGDTVRYASSTAAVTIDLAASTATGGHATGDVLTTVGGVSTIENAVGSGYGDTLRGDARANRLSGLAGNDTLDGRAGDDVVSGGEGVDTITGGDGADALAGEGGNDNINGGAGKDLLSGGDGADWLLGDADDDQLSGDAGNDTLFGGDGHDTLGGWQGDDTLYGEAGNDKLAGGDGNDILEGGDGIDQLAGEGGNDSLRGGAGSDSYLFDANSGIDTIIDSGNPSDKNKIFVGNAGPDRIWLSRAGDDLRVSVIGGNSVIVVSGYFKADQSGTRIFEIVTSGGSLFLDAAGPLLQAMSEASGALPGTMPKAVLDLLEGYWHPTGKAAPRVVDKSLATNEDVPISGQVGAIDQDSNITGYTLSTDASFGSVTLDAATGAWTYAPDANRHGNDRFVITVTDADGNSVRQNVDVKVVSVNDAPTDIFAPGVLEIDEGSATGLSLGVFTREDVDGAGDTPSYQLLDSAGDRFAITADGRLTVLNGAALDYEAQTSHTITVRVTDQAGAYFDKQFTVNVRNVNEVPYVVTPPATTVPTVVSEMATGGGGTVASFVIGDPDGTTPTLELTTNPYGWLETVGNTVRINPMATIDFEALAAAGATLEDTDGDGLKEIRLTGAVRATDGALSSATPTSFVFLIEDANDAPTSIGFDPALSSILERDRPEENAELAAILLGTLSATDPDIYGSADFANIVFSVDDSRFEIVNGNQLRLKAGMALDFETEPTITLAITATDRGGAGFGFTRNLVFSVANADDYLYGTAGADTLSGQANRDVIYGYGDFDTIAGGEGNDDLYGGDGIDVLMGDGGNDRLWGELGDDQIQGGLGNDELRGGDGNDVLMGMNGNDSLFGDAGNDSLDGGQDNDALDGGTGNDELYGSAGDDILSGGAGDDLIEGGAGADSLRGGDGFDTLSYSSSSSGVILNLATGVNGGGAAGDVVEDFFERVVGSAMADTITGTAGNDIVDGGFGSDTIYGGAGDDLLIGGAGNDYIDAQSGNDTLIGGAGNDILVGGDDSDVYLIDVNSGADEIRNYDPSGGDVDAIGYQDIDRNRLWFSRSGDDLVISVVGTGVQTTIKSWFAVADGSDRANYKIDFIIAGQHYSDTIDAEGLVALMAGYAKPATQAAYDVLHQDLAFENRWKNYWDANGAPVISSVGTQTIAEDGTLNVQFRVDDDLTPYAGMTVQATADGVVLDAPVVSAPDANGVRTITLRGAPNRSGQVVVTITATDPGGLVSQRSFTVDVTPQADAPIITRAVAAKNNVTGAIDLDIQTALVDQDGSEILEIRIANIPSGLTLNQGTDLGGGVWSLTPAQLAGLALLVPTGWSGDLAGLQALSITAIAKETATGQTAQTTQPFTVIINAAPTDIGADRALAVDESTAAGTVPNGTVVANFSGTDPDGDALTFSLVDNAGGRFAISTSGVLTVANGSLLDREAAASHVVRVKVTDPSGLSYEETFTIAVNNVNEAPTVPAATVLISLGAENAALAGQAVANLAATDPDGTAPTYVITSDPRSWFTIVGNQLKFRTGLSFDFEALKAAGMTVSDIDGDGKQEVVYTADVRATDGSLQSSGTRSVTVRIEDANDAPTGINADRTLTVAENVSNGTLVGNFTGVDQDVGDGLTYILVNDAGGRFALTSAGQLTVANGALLDYEGATTHAIVVRVSDGTATYDKTFNVAVTNVNEAPSTPNVATQPITTVVEGTLLSGVVAATLSATDPDGTAPGYQIASDPSAWFTIAGNQLKFKTSFNSDFETLSTASGVTLTDVDGDGQKEASYTVNVRATDGSLNSGNRAITVRIEDVNEAPVITTTGFSVSEGAPGAGQTLIGTVAVTDPDTQSYNENFRYSLTGGDTSRFSINQTTGQLYLQGQLDYETATSHQVQVTVKDQGGSGFTVNKTITINVLDVNSAPTFSGYHAYMAGTQTTFSLSQYSSDPDGDPLTFRIAAIYSGPGGPWVDPSQVQAYVSGGTLVIQYMPRSTSWDNVIDFIIEVKDPAGLTDTDTLRVTNFRGGSGLVAKTPPLEAHAMLAPVVIDLDGDGVELVSRNVSQTGFDMDGDGDQDRTGWVSGDDGLLALDRNRDGWISKGEEVSFAGDLAGAVSDLEGLKAYDSNGNDKLDAGDQRFAEFEVWRDANGDGISTAEELWSLADLSIASIDLIGQRTGASPNGAVDNIVYANSVFTRTDGSQGKIGDVFLAYGDSNPRIGVPDETGTQQRVGGGPRFGGRVRGLDDDGDPLFRPLPQSGDHGSGDAAPGRVDRRADRDLTPAQILAMAMQDGAWRESDSPRAPRAVPQSYASDDGGQDPSHDAQQAQRAGSESRRGGERMEPADAYRPDTSLARSALHDRLALSEKKRFQMVEAMSSFSAQPYAEFGLGTGKDPKTVELLTALPDFRISR